MAPEPASKKLEFLAVFHPWQSDKLLLPHKVAAHIAINHGVVLLRSPRGSHWGVKVRRDDKGQLWFTDGWAAFTIAHHLQNGYSLVFRYEGDFIFGVSVFDMSMCMKDYTLSGGENVLHTTNSKPSSCRNCANRLSEVEKRLDELENNSEKEHNKGLKRTMEEVTHELRPSLKKECETEMHAESRFTIRITEKQIHGKSVMHIPQRFQRSHKFGERNQRQVLLQDGDTGKQWPVKLRHRRTLQGWYTQCGTGWHKFCMENNAEPGDTCVFELIPGRGTEVMSFNLLKPGGAEAAKASPAWDSAPLDDPFLEMIE